MFFCRDISLPDQNCCVAPIAVSTFRRGQDKPLSLEFEGIVSGQKVSYEPAVFAPLNAARAVADCPARSYHLLGGSEQLALYLDQSPHRLRGNPVASFDSSGQHACVRAGYVQENGIEV